MVYLGWLVCVVALTAGIYSILESVKEAELKYLREEYRLVPYNPDDFDE